MRTSDGDTPQSTVGDALGPDLARRALSDVLVREAANVRRATAARIHRCGLASDPREVQELCNEIWQEVARRAWDKADEFDPAQSGHAWLDLFALNVFKENRRQIYRDRQRGTVADTRPRANPEFDPLEGLLAPDCFATARVDELLALVEPADRELLRRHVVLDEPVEDLAAELGVSRGAMYTRLSRARGRLRAAHSQLHRHGEDD